MEDVPSQNTYENTPISINSPYYTFQSKMGAWPDLTRHQDLPSWPDSLCFMRSFAITGIRQGGYTAAQEKGSSKFHTISWNESGGGSRASHPPTWEKVKPISSPRRAQPRTPDCCWANTEPQECNLWFSDQIQAGTPSYTEQIDAGHCRQKWDMWTWWVFSLHFLTDSNIAIMMHNTREYNCCSDYLQPLH